MNNLITTNRSKANQEADIRLPEVIEADKLIKSFREFVAVKGISFSVYPGECFGLLGPNGAGKSTTVKMIYSLSPVTSGTLKVFGYDITQYPREIKARLGVVAQEDNLDPELTVRENLVVFARYFKIPKKEALRRASELLSFMELESKADTIVDHLSGGMKRRLTIARALINKPELIILDEPTTGLDPHARHMVWQKIRSLKDQGTTILLTTHYLEEAAQLCDRLVFINEGMIIDEGKPKDLILTHIGHQVLELSVNTASNTFGTAGNALEGNNLGDNAFEINYSLLEKELSDNCTHLVNGYKRFGNTLYVYTNRGGDLQEKIKLLGLDFSYQLLRPATLEDVFLKLTGRGLDKGDEA